MNDDIFIALLYHAEKVKLWRCMERKKIAFFVVFFLFMAYSLYYKKEGVASHKTTT